MPEIRLNILHFCRIIEANQHLFIYLFIYLFIHLFIYLFMEFKLPGTDQNLDFLTK